MKKRDIYEVAIKIIGIVAAWKFIESIIASVLVYITYYSLSTNLRLDFMGIYQTNISVLYIFSIVLYGIFGYLFLFMTGKMLNLLKLTDSTEVTLQIETKNIYHIVVLSIGFFMLIYSASRLTTSTYYKTENSTTQQTTEQLTTIQNPTGEKNKTIVSTSTTTSPRTSTTVNYINILMLLLSILIIIKSEKFSSILMPNVKEELVD